MRSKLAMPGLRIVCALAAVLLCYAASGSAVAAASEAGNSQAGNPSAVSFSLPAGSYSAGFVALELSAGEGADIHYTLDGSVPTAASPRYDRCLMLTDRTAQPSQLMAPENIGQMVAGGYTINDGLLFPKANVVRAVAVGPDGSTGPVATATYFVGMDLAERYAGFPVFSIVTDPENLLDYESGIMVLGAVYDRWVESGEARQVIESQAWQHFQANFTQKGRDWERAASIELLVDGSPAVAFDGGIRLKGSYSRVYPQRSINVYLRKSYGQGSLRYELIPQALDVAGNVIGEYSSFSLRSGGNDAPYLKFRDAFLQSLMEGRAFDTQATVPAVVFLNGEFMGVYNLQEKYSDDYFAQRYGVDSAEVVVMKDGELEEGADGDLALYDELMAFAGRDLSDPAAWSEFAALVDLESLLDYYATEVYIGNRDWHEDSNYELWRTRTVDPSNPYADGRWRFCVYDVEQSSGMYGADGGPRYDEDSLAVVIRWHPLLDALLHNADFRQMFLERLDEVGRTDFEPGRVTERLGEYASSWKTLVAASRLRFGGFRRYSNMVGDIEDFFAHRHDHIVALVADDLAAYEESGGAS